MEGNERFVTGRPRYQRTDAEWRAGLVNMQLPFATILGCSDSRVPVEIIFDQGFGDLFVIRVAGNVVGENERGSIEFAVKSLNTPLVMVLGHENCGAVTAALSPAEDRQKEWEGIQKLLNHIDPALQDIDPSLPLDQKIHIGVEANVRWSRRQLENIPELQKNIEKGKLLIAGGIYELETGQVRLIQ